MKMKLFMLTNLLFCGTLFSICAEEADNTQLKAEHKITQATLYQSRAMLTNEAMVKLQPGRNIISFEGIPDNIDLRSIRVNPVDRLQGEILGVTWERTITTIVDNNKLLELEKQEKDLQNEIDALNDKIKITDIFNKIVADYKDQMKRIISEQATVNIEEDSKDKHKWDSAFDMLSEHTTTTNQEKLTFEIEKRKLEEQLRKVRIDLNNFASSSRTTRVSIIVTIDSSSERPQDIALGISYITYAASWIPKYDVRVLGDNKVTLDYYAEVFQTTGIDWRDISVILSTAQPQISATPPPLTSLFLSGEKKDDGKSARGITEVLGNEVANNLSYDLAESMPAREKASGWASGTVTSDGPSVVFNIQGKHTILFGNRPSKLSILNQDFPATVLYETSPSIRHNVYLKAMFKNASPFLFLPGSVAIYRNSGYIGTSSLKLTPQNAEIAIFAGTLDGMGVTRKQEVDYKKTTGTFSKTENQYTGFRTVLLNNTGKAVALRVREQIPVSEVEEVKVELVTQPVDLGGAAVQQCSAGYTLEKENGLLYWDITLKPGEKRNIDLLYCISRNK